MENGGFVHLHCHSEYSLLDGACRIKSLIQKAKELCQPAIAITDHGAMFGVCDFFDQCKNEGIKPIIGCEVYVAPRKMSDKEHNKDSDYFHLILLVKNETGYKNLIKMVSLSYTQGFYYKPRIDIELLENHKEGLIALSACLKGEIPQKILNGDLEGAKNCALKYKNIFQDDFYLELQDHNLEDEKKVIKELVKIGQELLIELVATNDVHYIEKEDSSYQDVLMCIQTGKQVSDTDRMRFSSDEFYLKSNAQMETLFKNYKNAILNTTKIADKCNFEFEYGKLHLPSFNLNNNISSFEFLKSLCEKGVYEKYNNPSKDIIDRLSFELSIIEKMGFVDYFLIVWDFIKYAKDNGIMVGPGRGSAAGSLVSYSLSITTVDPISFNLLFERFLNPERISMPDIDIDFCYERRGEVIDYVIKKYGVEKVAQIITFGTMAARASIRDVGRVLSIPYADVDRVAKMIPFELNITIEKALEINSSLKNLYDENIIIKNLVDTAKAIEGMPRHSSTHAAGIVITKEPVYNYVPLQKNDEVVTTQFPMNTLEKLGLLKMDFLGLRTLTVIRDTVFNIEKSSGIKIDINSIPFDDEKVFRLLQSGNTDGVFQLESVGMKSFLKELCPINLEDIIAGISLYRPGPMDQIPKYIENKNNPLNIKYKCEHLKSILDVTYGCIVYQEQVMQIVRELSGYSLGRADTVRRAMSKKKLAVMEKEKHTFIYGSKEDNISGAVNLGISEKIATEIFDEMMDFAKYAFNKSHAACYAVIAYQTAYLKANYPVQFMAALLTSVLQNTSKVSQYKMECGRMGILVTPPDINTSYGNFTANENKISFGLVAVKNVGKNLINDVVLDREKNGKFKSFTDFCERMSSYDINKRAIESLIKCGAFDSLETNRKKLVTVFEMIIDEVLSNKKNNLLGQVSLFSDNNKETFESTSKYLKKDIENYTKKQLLNMEKEIMGIYLSGHPLDEFKNYLEKINYSSTFEIKSAFESLEEGGASLKDGDTVTVAGIIISKKTKTTKNQSFMAFVTIEDLYGTIEVIVFPKVLQNFSGFITEDEVLCIKGKLSMKEDEEPKIICEEAFPITESDKNAQNKLYIKICEKTQDKMPQITEKLRFFGGMTPVLIYNSDTKKTVIAKKDLWVTPSKLLINELTEILGNDSVKLV